MGNRACWSSIARSKVERHPALVVHILGYRHVDQDSTHLSDVAELSLPLICELKDMFLHLIGGMGFILSAFHETILIHSKFTPSTRYNVGTITSGGNFSIYQQGAPEGFET